jgi:N-acetylglucosamine kinase-like BadF-type ATPase
MLGPSGACQLRDGRGPATQLVDALLRRLDLTRPHELVLAVYATAADRARIASLADLVSQAAEDGDAQAQQILEDAASELAELVAAVARKLGFSDATFPLALPGGALLGSRALASGLKGRLSSLGLRAVSVASVHDPLLGELKLGQRET